MKIEKKKWEVWITWTSIVGMMVGAWWIAGHYELTEKWIRQAGIAGPLVSVGLYALLSLTPIPSDPLTLLNGVLFGWVKGFFISFWGNNAAALVEYIIARNMRQLAKQGFQPKKIPDWLSKWPANSAWFLIAGRFVPGFGGKLVSIMAGMYQVPWWKYLWTTAVANIFGSAVYMAGGLSIIETIKYFVEWLTKIN